MRKHKVIEITDEGRDKGKHFFVMEMPARVGEKFAYRAWFLIAKGGVEVPVDLKNSGWQGLAILGLSGLAAGVPFEEAEPLLDQLFDCVRAIPDLMQFRFEPDFSIDSMPGARAIVDSDTEEIATRLQLRVEAFKIHTDFSQPGSESKITTSEATSTEPGSMIIPTSPLQSPPRSPRGRPPLRTSIHTTG